MITFHLKFSKMCRNPLLEKIFKFPFLRNTNLHFIFKHIKSFLLDILMFINLFYVFYNYNLHEHI